MPQIVVTLILFTSGVLLLADVVPPNRRFGLRTDRTLADRVAWYRAHRAVGWLCLAISIMTAVWAAASPLHPAWLVVGVVLEATACALVYRRYAV